MYITNYNGISHDIYIFGVTSSAGALYGDGGSIPTGTTYSSLLCAVPPTLNEDLPGIRVRAPALRYNTSGLWNSNTIGHTADFSGLSVRDRGSNISNAWDNYKDNVSIVNNATVPYTDNVHNFLNWNNGIPSFVIISETHFIGCEHFIGEENESDQIPRFLGKNNSFYDIRGTFVDTFGSDGVLYEMNPPLTDEQKSHLAIYEWLDIAGINDYYRNDIVLWRQSNQGFFVAYKPDNGTIEHSSLTSPPGGGFPVWDGTIWSGDSGTPVLATYKGKTYLCGIADGTFYGSAYNSKCSVGSVIYEDLTDRGVVLNISNILYTQISSGWYLHKDENGYEQFILAPKISGVIDIIYDNIKQRTAKGSSENWKSLKDFTETLDQVGAHRVQRYFDIQTTPTVNIDGECS